MTTALKHSCLVLLIAALLSSCYDKDITNVDSALIYTPEYSVPIGSESFTMEDIVSSSSFDTIPADSAYWVDSIIFQYNERYYYLPPEAWFDTIYTKDFDFAQIEDWLNKATYLMFRLNMRNGIPGNVVTQIEFLDASQQALFTLFNDPGFFIPAANNEIPTVLQEDVYLTEEELEMLPSVMHLRVYFRIYIDDISSEIAYYADQDFELQMGLRVGLEIDMNE